MKLSFVLILLVLSLGVLACGDTTSRDDDLRASVEAALDAFAAELVSDRPADVEAYNERLLAYTMRPTPISLVRAYCSMTRMATSRTCYTSTIRMTGTSTRTFTRPTRSLNCRSGTPHPWRPTQVFGRPPISTRVGVKFG